MLNSQKRLAGSHKWALLLACIVIVFLFVSLVSQDRWVDSAIHSLSGTVGYRQNPWVMEPAGEGAAGTVTLPGFKKMETGKHYTLKTTITYDGSKDESPYAFLHIDHVFCRILVDGQEMFSYMPEDVHKWDRSKSPGFIYKAFPMPRDCMGKEIEIQLLPPLNNEIEYGMPDLLFGDYTSSLRGAIKRDVPHDLMMFFCALLGIGSLLFAALTLEGPVYREGLSIGVFCLTFAAYMLTECRINNFYIANPYGLYLMNYISLSMLPIAFMCFMRERLPEKYHSFWNKIVSAAIAIFLLLAVAHFAGIYDFKEAVTVIHLVDFFQVALVIALMLTMENRKRKYYLLLQSAPLVAGMLLDMITYQFHCKIGSNDAAFTIMGVLMFLVLEIIHIWNASADIYEKSVHSKIYWQMAFVDELTGVGNRRAYDDAISDVMSGQKRYQSMVAVSVDVNKLKYVNDHFGHAAGDDLIAGAAWVIKAAISGKSGQVFRTGGDEFAVFLYDMDEEHYEESVNVAKKEVADFNKDRPYELSMSVGSHKVENRDILKAMQAADQKMYENKAENNMSRE